MEYSSILTILRRYSLESKMKICNMKSRELLCEHGIKPVNELLRNVYPWEVEEFLLFSLMSGEWKNQDLSENEKTIQGMFNQIRNFNHPRLMEKKGLDFANTFIMLTGQMQFMLQEAMIFRICRYYYFFMFKNKDIDMVQEFVNKFNCQYQDVLNFSLLLHAIYCNKEVQADKIQEVIRVYPHVLTLLSIDIQQFRERQEEFTKDYMDYKYGFKYFYQYPIIEYNGIYYFTLPHLIIPSCTTSLLYRITENNNRLKEKFGKYVLENYIFDILNSFGIYECVKPEQEYIVGRQRKDSPDILIKDGNVCILVESKSFVLPNQTRVFNEEVFKKFQDRVSKAIVQVYTNLVNEFNKKYYPFGKETIFEKNNIFGVVVVIEDVLCERHKLYEKAALDLDIDVNSDEYRFLCSNIRVISLIELERKSVSQQSLVDALILIRDDEEKWFDLVLPETEQVTSSPIQNNYTYSLCKVMEIKEEIFNVCLGKKCN